MNGLSLHLLKLHTLELHVDSVPSSRSSLSGHKTSEALQLMHNFLSCTVLPAVEQLSIALSVCSVDDLVESASDPHWPRIEGVLLLPKFRTVKSIRVRAYTRPQERFIPVSSDVVRSLLPTLALRPVVDLSPLSNASCVFHISCMFSYSS